MVIYKIYIDIYIYIEYIYGYKKKNASDTLYNLIYCCEY